MYTPSERPQAVSDGVRPHEGNIASFLVRSHPPSCHLRLPKWWLKHVTCLFMYILLENIEGSLAWEEHQPSSWP